MDKLGLRVKRSKVIETGEGGELRENAQLRLPRPENYSPEIQELCWPDLPRE